MNRDHYLIPSWPAPNNVVSFTSLRDGGYSQAPFNSYNLGDHVSDNQIHVKQNRAKLISDWQLMNSPYWLDQVHGIQVINLDHPSTNRQADACFTCTTHTACAVLTADCLPLLICHQAGKTIAAVHAGWRGLLHGVIANTITQLPCRAEELLVWLGPAIGPNEFIVGEPVKHAFIAANKSHANAFTPHEQNKYCCNLYTLAKVQLHKLGIERIYGDTLCTFTDQKRFFSYRRNKQTGRMVSLIAIKES